MENQQPTISAIVPIYNVEEYLEECIDSLLQQNISLEIILVNDGSTDSSGNITNSYQQKDDRIKVIHQKNQGLSATRNVGLKYAMGEYVVFIDSDDWIEKDSLSTMYRKAHSSDADMLIGQIEFCYPNGEKFKPFEQILNKYENVILSGKEWFTALLSFGIHYLMVCNYMYRREWLIKEDIFFEKVIHEDELWTPTALSKAKKVAVMNNTFYYYRQREGSIMHSLINMDRLKSLLFIANKLAEYSQDFTFRNDREFKSWLWADIMRLYSIAFEIVSRIRNSTFILPKHYLYTLPRICGKLDSRSKSTVKHFYLSAKSSLKEYLLWRNHPSIRKEYNADEQDLVLIYNNPKKDIIQYLEIPCDFFVTTDRRYLMDAHIVIFYMPDLFEHLEDDLDKSEDQKWIAYFDKEQEYKRYLQNEELVELFDEQIIAGGNTILESPLRIDVIRDV